MQALIWPAVDVEARRLTVRQALTRARRPGDPRGVVRFRGPKTAAGERTLPLGPDLATVLASWRPGPRRPGAGLRCPTSPDRLVFPDAFGRPLHRSTLQRQGLEPACARAGVRRFTLKALRHYYASRLIQAGRPLTEIARLMGHADATVTLKVYAHVLRDAVSDDVAALLSDGLAPAALADGVQIGVHRRRLTP